MSEFFLDPLAGINRTSHIEDLRVSPARLVEVFGQPEEFDNYKVSGQYRFVDDYGNVFTVSDYKQTNLYNRSLVTPDEFWVSKQEVWFSIGGKFGTDKLDEFLSWIQGRLA